MDIIKEGITNNRVLECEVASGTAYIVAGNQHLLELKVYEGIAILPHQGFDII